jgi:UDP-N-acetylglucosamine pyrophosphorylase
MENKFATVIMAAGKGTRMKNSEKAKVMFEVAGKPMIHHVVDLAVALHSSRIIAVVGHYRDTVIEYLRPDAPSVEFAVQEPQLGTGHAVMQAKDPLRNFIGDVLVLSGDVPLLRESTIRNLISFHHEREAVGTILTADLADPTGYGRVIRGNGDNVTGIVEHKDATEEERKVREINSGIYIFDNVHLFDALANITTNNVQHEYYLTDVFSYFWKHGMKVAAKKAEDFDEVRGVNTLEQLEDADRILKERNPAPGSFV